MSTTLADVAVAVHADVRRLKPEVVAAADSAGKAAGDHLGDGITRGVDGKLRDANGRLIKAGTVSGAAIGEGVTRGVDGKLRDSASKFVAEGDKVGANIGKGVRGGLGRSLKGIESNGGAFSKVFALMGARALLFAGAAASAAPAVLKLTGALLPAAGAVNILPAALLAGKTALLTFKLATAGVGDAMKAQLTGSAKEAKKALEDLPPAARAFVTSLAPMRSQIAALRNAVSARFFKPLIDDVAPLARVLFPLLTRQMPALAGALGGVGEQIAKTGRSAVVVQGISDTFLQTRNSVVVLRGAIDPLAKALFSTVSGTASLLPGLAQGFVNVAQRVGAFITEAAQTGRIRAGFEAAMTVLTQLGQVVLNVISIFRALFIAANSESQGLLGNLVKLTDQVAVFLFSDRGDSALTATFRTLNTFSGALRQGLAAVLPQIATSLSIVAPALAGLAGPAVDLVKAIAPLLPFAASLAALLVRTLTPAIAALSKFLSENAGIIKAALIVYTAYTAATVALGFAAKVQAAGGLIAFAKSITIVSNVQKIAAVTSTALGVAFRFMMGPIGLIITAIGLLAAAVVYLFNHNKAFHDFVIAAWNGIKVAIGAVVNWITGTVWPALKKTWDAIATASLWLWHNVIQPVWNGIVAVIRGAITVVSAVVGAVVAYYKNVVGPVFMWLWHNIIEPVWHGIERVIQAASAVIQLAVAIVVAYYRNVVGPVFLWLWHNIIEPVWHGIEAVVKWAAGGIMTAVRAVWSWLRTVFGPVFTWLGGVISSVWNSVTSATSSAWDKVLKFLAPIVLYVKTTLVNAFHAAVDGIKSAWDKVQEVAKVPVSFVVNHVINPLIGGFNKVAKIFHTSEIPPIAGFAEGGKIPGPASSKDNRWAYLKSGGRVLGTAGLATGEYVVKASQTATNLAALEAINNGSGPVAMGYADGGFVGGVKDFFGGLVSGAKSVAGIVTNPGAALQKLADGLIDKIPGGGLILDVVKGMAGSVVAGIKKLLSTTVTATGSSGAGFPAWPSSPSAQRGDSGVWKSIVALIKSTGPVSGSFGNGYRAGDPLWHGSGRAVDWMGFNQDALATFLAARQPLELIHRTAKRDYAYTRGVNKGSFNESLMQAHRNHVHIAKALGGVTDIAQVASADFGSVTLARGHNMVYNGTGRAEPLVSPDMAGPQRLHPDDIAAIADAIGGVVGYALTGTIPAAGRAARQIGKRPR